MMEHRPVHIICSLTVQQFNERTQVNGIPVEIIAEDQDQEGPHIHAYTPWPIGRTEAGHAVLKPRRPNWVRGSRRKYGCHDCHNSQSNARCPNCGLWFKFIWPKSDEHVENIKRYINRKINPLLWRQQLDEERGAEGEN